MPEPWRPEGGSLLEEVVEAEVDMLMCWCVCVCLGKEGWGDFVKVRLLFCSGFVLFFEIGVRVLATW